MKITLANLHEATAQQVFDQGAEHLLVQGVPCLNDAGDCCMYRWKDLKCVGGCFISDEEYSKDFERNGWEGLTRFFNFPKEHSDLIQSLQAIHDSQSDWFEKLKNLCKKLKLEWKFDKYENNIK